MDLMSQVYAVIFFAIFVVVLPYVMNKWSDTRAGVR
jgi:hypothetical protein